MSQQTELRRAKHVRAYQRLCVVQRQDGRRDTVERFEILQTYLGLIEGLPRRPQTARQIERVRDHVAANWGGPQPVVLEPDLLDPDSESPILPSATLMAQLYSGAPRNDDEDGSWMNLIWFADLDASLSIPEIVQVALDQVDWERQADSFLI